jgi:hypothetical protein
MDRFFNLSNKTFDMANRAWKSNINRRSIGILLILIYLASLIVIELGRRKLLPPSISALIPRSHFYAISFTFTFLLYIEVIDLVFGLARSVSEALGKQFEIFSLILLRQSFKEFAHLPEPLHWPKTIDPILYILSNAGGALIIFFILVCYYRILYHQPITYDQKEEFHFISAKKTISLILLITFAAMGILFSITYIQSRYTFDFFTTFYTVLVFSDILIVLVSLRYSHAFPVVFRNSGFALATVMLRLSLTAPPYYNAGLGICAALYVLALKYAYNRFVPLRKAKG